MRISNFKRVATLSVFMVSSSFPYVMKNNALILLSLVKNADIVNFDVDDGIIIHEQNQYGYKLTLKKVEIAKTETRAYVKVENSSKNNLSFYSFNSVLTQGSNQIDPEDNWEANYPKISSEIRPGIIQEGVVTFKPIDVNGGDCKIIFEGNSDDYSLDFTPFTFEVKMN